MATVQTGLAVALADRAPEVRAEAIMGLVAARTPAPALRARLTAEPDESCLRLLIRALGDLKDAGAAAGLAALAQDAARPADVRAEALDALGMLGGPQVLRTRFALVYDPKAPPALVRTARCPAWAARGVLPAQRRGGLPDEPVARGPRGALRALHARRPLPADVRAAVIDRLNDKSDDVRGIAIETAARLNLREGGAPPAGRGQRGAVPGRRRPRPRRPPRPAGPAAVPLGDRGPQPRGPTRRRAGAPGDPRQGLRRP